MSKEQWGHGYHKGVEDALVGNLDHSFDAEKLSKKLVASMMLNNRYKSHDRTLYSVRQARMECKLIWGMKEEYFKILYSYIMKNETFGCYVSGYPNDDMYADYFCLNPYLFNENKLKCIIEGADE